MRAFGRREHPSVVDDGGRTTELDETGSSAHRTHGEPVAAWLASVGYRGGSRTADASRYRSRVVRNCFLPDADMPLAE